MASKSCSICGLEGANRATHIDSDEHDVLRNVALDLFQRATLQLSVIMNTVISFSAVMYRDMQIDFNVESSDLTVHGHLRGDADPVGVMLARALQKTFGSYRDAVDELDSALPHLNHDAVPEEGETGHMVKVVNGGYLWWEEVMDALDNEGGSLVKPILDLYGVEGLLGLLNHTDEESTVILETSMTGLFDAGVLDGDDDNSE